MTVTPLNTAPSIRTGRWAIDVSHSSISFAVSSLGISLVRGRFTRFDATLIVGSSIEASTLEATVELASIDTANFARDEHLRSADLLDVERRPTMVFVSERFVAVEGGWRVDGRLSIGSISRPLTLDVQFGGIADSFDGTRHAGFRATGQLRRSDFAIDVPGGIPDTMLGNTVDVELDVQLVEP